MQNNKYFNNQDVKMYCETNQFPGLQFLGPHKKTHGVHGLCNNYHMHFDTKLGHGTCATHRIPFVCPLCTSMIDQIWDPGIPAHQQPHYQPIKYCT